MPAKRCQNFRVAAFRESQLLYSNKNPRLAAGALFRVKRKKTQAFSLRRTTPARPINPVPNRTKEPGSGTTMFVSPLLTPTAPLKKPSPVLTVSCTVEPVVLNPDAVDPARVPESV